MASLRPPQSLRVFLSYADSDREMAWQIRDALTRARIEVWDAAREVAPGENIGSALDKALRTCNAFVTLISPAATRSTHVTRQVEFALTHPAYRDRLVAVKVRPTADFPWILKELKFIDSVSHPENAPRQVLDTLRQSVRRSLPASA